MDRASATHDHLLKILGRRLQQYVPAIYSRPIERPLVEGSAFRFNATGCIDRPLEVFNAIMSGLLSEDEMEAICLHRMVCWKCNETFAAYRLRFNQRALRRARQRRQQRNSKPSDEGSFADKMTRFAARC